MDYAYKNYPSIIKNVGLNGFSDDASNINDESISNKIDCDNYDKSNTLEKILQHVVNIDEKLK